MAERRDCRGLAITAANDRAVENFDRAVRSYLGLRLDPGDHLKGALSEDPGLVLGHVLRGYFMLLFANRKLLGRAASSLEAARAAIEARGGTARERRHVEALAAWAGGDPAAALSRWDSILIEDPLDVLALKLSEYWNFYFGDNAGMCEVQQRVAPAWRDGVPDYGKVLGMQAFALEECGQYEAAEARGRRAVEIDPEDLWSCHAVSHVLEMTGRQQEGIDWISGLAANFGACNAVVNHLWWHRALFQFELGRFEDVLALYDEEIAPAEPVEYLDVCNAVSLLWRLEEEGVDVGDRWTAVAAAAASRAGDLQLVFADVHYAMALAAAGRDRDLESLLAAAESYAADPDEPEAAVMAGVGLAVGRAMAAYRRGDWDIAVDLLYPRRRAIRSLGGSNAQRDLFQRALIHAAEKSGRIALARSLLSERRAQRPTSVLAKRRYDRLAA